MQQADTPSGRGRVTGRWPLWPLWLLAAGVSLGAAAAAEAVLRAEDSGVIVPVALLMGLCATVPLSFARGHTAAAAALITAATVLTVLLYQGPTTGLVALLAVWLLLARRRVRRVRAEAAAGDAARRDIESTLLELTLRGERARIARDLHDVVAHHISMISVQAETARLTIPGMPEEGARHLAAIGDTARAALGEMRRLLGVLREDAGQEPARAPQPGLGQLLELIEEARDSAAARARLIVGGRVAALDPGVELAAYRVVQEALTNARRHAPGSCVDVELDYAEEGLRLRVRDNGPGPPPAAPGGGHGLLGMRERVAAAGGELRTGPAPLGGFLVEAEFPAARPAGAGGGG